MNSSTLLSRFAALACSIFAAAVRVLRTAFCLYVSGSGYVAMLLVALSPAPLPAANLVNMVRTKNGGDSGAAAGNPSGGTGGQAVDSATATALAQAQRQSLVRTAQAIAAARQAQAAARAAALAGLSTVPNGLIEGGLVVADGATPGSELWQGADGPTQTHANGATVVDIKQQAQKAILTWEQFNVGRETTVNFDQQGNRDWVALNRVTDPSARPSQIQGQIKADGAVYIINRNGVIFGGASQVNVGNLIAATADIKNVDFLGADGIYSRLETDPADPWGPGKWTPSFTEAGGNVVVEAGAQLSAAAPSSAVEGGGFVLLMGKEVENRGVILAPKGQVALAAGDDFYLGKGYGTDANATATTRGNRVASDIRAGSTSGKVSNSGLIESQQGDITLAGKHVVQDGVAVATTSVNNAGTIHLLTNMGDVESTVTLTGNAVTAILPELDSDETATDAQREVLAKSSMSDQSSYFSPGFNNESDYLHTLQSRRDKSLIEIRTGGIVDFQADSLTIAPGGQINVAAVKRIFVADDALLDVAGTTGTLLAADASTLFISKLQPFEMRDSAVNRDTGFLNNSDVYIDINKLLYVPAGTAGVDTDRYYTGGGLLEVAGFLGNQQHKIGEWTAVGGSITLRSAEVIAQQGAVFDISGGSVTYAAGQVKSTRLLGIDGKLYDINDAPLDMTFVGLGNAHVERSEKWGVTKVYTNPLTNQATVVRDQESYTVGRDAGSLNLITPTAVFEGTIKSDVTVGERQTAARPAFAGGATQDAVTGLSHQRPDAYRIPANVVPLGGSIVVTNHNDSAPFYTTDVNIGETRSETTGMGARDALAPEQTNTIHFSAGQLSDAGLGSIAVKTDGGFTVDDALTLAHGGQLFVRAATVDVNADITTRGGQITLTAAPGSEPTAGGLTVADGVTLDVHGTWVNALLDPERASDLAFINGGRVFLQASQGVTLGEGSLVDVSGGVGVNQTGKIVGGKGGDIALIANMADGNNTSSAGVPVVMGGELRAYGFAGKGGGTLTLSTGDAIGVGGDLLETGDILKAGEAAPVTLSLAEAMVVLAGEVLPADFNLTITTLQPGQPILADALNQMNIEGVVTAANWTLGPGFMVYDESWSTSYTTGDTIPAGTVLGYAQLAAGSVLPADVFPSGIPLYSPVTITTPAGSIAPADITFSAGSKLAKGTILGRDVRVNAGLMLKGEFFQQGFSQYNINSQAEMIVAKDAVVDVLMPTYRVDAVDFQSIPSDADPSAAFRVVLDPLFMEDAHNAVITQRKGASISLSSIGSQGDRWKDPFGTNMVGGRNSYLEVKEGAKIRVDNGQSINLSSVRQLTVNGSLEARGGDITLVSKLVGNTAIVDYPPNPNYDPTLSIWIGEQARLDASAEAVVRHDAQGRSYGFVSEAGSIKMGASEGGYQSGPVGNAYVIVREGAVLDVSGAQATLDVPVMGQGGRWPSGGAPVDIASSGGDLYFGSQYGVFLDGTLLAHAGGKNALGGSLTVELASPYNANVDGRDVPDYMRNHRRILIGDHYHGELPENLAPGEVFTGNWIPGQTYQESLGGSAGLPDLVGQARLGVDQIEATGVDSLTLKTTDIILFDGPDAGMSLRLGNLLRLDGVVGSLNPLGNVELQAPYVQFTGNGLIKGDRMVKGTSGSSFWYGSGQDNESVLTVKAHLLEFGGNTRFGASGQRGLTYTKTEPYDYAGFGLVDFVVDGDVRFLNTGDLNSTSLINNTTTLISSGDIRFRVDQIYPVSGAFAQIVAGANALDRRFGEDSTITIERYDPARPLPLAPYSARGSIWIAAGTVNQGGIVRAPFGGITLGTNGELKNNNNETLIAGTTRNVNLLPGSITSVSGAGLVIPFGGTSDNLTWNFNDPGLQRHIGSANPAGDGIAMKGQVMNVEEGAILDLSGGGALAGAGFVEGRGGSTDARFNPFPVVGDGRYVQPGLSTNPIYAIIPGYANDYAPTLSQMARSRAGLPAVGEQITIPAGIPGLPAGTYTLLPAEYALVPGAFRVELNKSLSIAGAPSVVALLNGSYSTAGRLGIANTSYLEGLLTGALITPGETMRKYSQYNESSYDRFQITQPATAQFDNVRGLLTVDARNLSLDFSSVLVENSGLNFRGTGLFGAAEGGQAGGVVIAGHQTDFEVIARGSSKNDGFLSLYAEDLNTIKASYMVIGGPRNVMMIDGALATVTIGGGNSSSTTGGSASSVIVRSGAELRAPQLFLVAADYTDYNDPARPLIPGRIVVESGATISTVGMGDAPYLPKDGYIYSANSGAHVLAISNGVFEISAGSEATAGGITLEDGSRVTTDGSLVFATTGAVSIGDNASWGARYLGFSTNTINLGGAEALARAAADGVLIPGMAFTQGVLDRLISGASGASKLERLMLSANQSMNIYGSIDLDTIDPATGKSSLDQLVLITPAIYGHGVAGDSAAIRTGMLVWNGIMGASSNIITPPPSSVPGGTVPGGPGFGLGSLSLEADTIILGYQDGVANGNMNTAVLDRLLLGFSEVSLVANDRITVRNNGTLHAYQQQPVFGESGIGGNLKLVTPLITADAAGKGSFTVGDSITLTAPQGAPAAVTASIKELGGELNFNARTITADTAIALPSGKLALSASDDLTLTGNARIDVAGREVEFFEEKRYSWGGDIVLESRDGDIVQQDGALLDFSAAHNHAGKLSATAGQGLVALRGGIKGASTGATGYDAGSIAINAKTLEDFTGLNLRLNENGVTQSRNFVIGSGDLAIGDNVVKARHVSVSVDGGSLTVDGRIDASGDKPGSIRLSARDELTLTGRANLDAHGDVLQVDSYGQPVEALNRATVELTAAAGLLTLQSGAKINLGSPDGVSRGRIELNASRLGANDAKINVSSPVAISGADSIAVNAFRTWTAADGIINQAYMGGIHDENTAYINAALANAGLMDGKLAGLRDAAYADAFHFRPGVEIRSGRADGTLEVSGDIDLAGHRYASVNPRTPKTAGYGSGEAGSLVIRAANDLDIHGSITDGFAKPVRTPDDNGWVMYPGGQGQATDTLASDFKVPSGMALTLDPGSAFPNRGSLGFDIVIGNTPLKTGAVVPVKVKLAQPYTVSSNTIATADIFAADGTTILFAKGSQIASGTVLAAGTILDKGTRLPGQGQTGITIAGMVWPAGTTLDVFNSNVTTTAAITVAAGSVLPGGSTLNFTTTVPSGALTAPWVAPSDIVLLGGNGGTTIAASVTSTAVMPFDAIVSGRLLRRDGVAIPFGFVSSGVLTMPSYLRPDGWRAQAPIWASLAAYESNAAPLYNAGDYVTATINTGAYFGAGTVLPQSSASNVSGYLNVSYAAVSAGAPLNVFTAAVTLTQNVRVAAGTELPVGAMLQVPGGAKLSTRPTLADGSQGRNWAIAKMLPQGSQSWNLRLVAGADLTSADTRTLRPAAELEPAGLSGDLVLSDRHYMSSEVEGISALSALEMKRRLLPSVIRTGIGSLDLLAGGDYTQMSHYGIYTAGTPSEDIGATTPEGYNEYNRPRSTISDMAGTRNPWLGDTFAVYAESAGQYQAWYPEHGGDFFMQAQGDATGYSSPSTSSYVSSVGTNVTRRQSNLIGDWLWRQGAYDFAAIDPVPTAWWINFGTYILDGASPTLIGFTGLGTLGGGNVTVDIGRDAGATRYIGVSDSLPDATTALNFVVAGTGRVTEITRNGRIVTGGNLVQTGGGELRLNIGGGLNPGRYNHSNINPADLGGYLLNLRGDIRVNTGSVGQVIKNYGRVNSLDIDPRLQEPTRPIGATSYGGIVVAPGDSRVTIQARGDLVVAGASDPGRVESPGSVALTRVDADNNRSVVDGDGLRSAFTLWRPQTALILEAAGGSLTPLTANGVNLERNAEGNGAMIDSRYWYPALLHATAFSGNIHYGTHAISDYTQSARWPGWLELMPSPYSSMEFLAGGSIIVSGNYRFDSPTLSYHPFPLTVTISGMEASADSIPNPFRPSFLTPFAATTVSTATAPLALTNAFVGSYNSFDAFLTDSAAGRLYREKVSPALFYAAGGDIFNLGYGALIEDIVNNTVTYYGAKGFEARAARDIVGIGTAPALRGKSWFGAGGNSGVIIHNDPSDISVVSAGRDILYANLVVAGPGQLVLEAGRNFYQSGNGFINSMGPIFNITPETRNGGAGITVLTGVGSGGPDYDAFIDRYLDPVNQANPELPLADQPGKAIKVYTEELLAWLAGRFDFEGGADEALAYFRALPGKQREVFARQVYFAELKAGGREYNNPDSSRFQSYLRGREAIATLFPTHDADGNKINYEGSVNMLGASGIRTTFGGDIEFLVAGGETQIGVPGPLVPSTAGVLTMGSGAINIYSLGSVLLGQSRLFSTFGGDILVWSAEGDINAGRGAKSTVVYQPPRRVTDNLGNISLSPAVPSTGAGIATLRPLPEVPPGDIDLIAPLGVIDAGEAGIRVSGNVNLAALQVLNAANIQVEGNSVGMPVAVTPNIGAITNAANNAGAAVAAMETATEARRAPMAAPVIPSVFRVQVIGYGGLENEEPEKRTSQATPVAAGAPLALIDR